MSNILVICAHPDDEVIGIGGTVKKHALAGDRVSCLILGEGMAARQIDKGEERKELEALHESTLKSAQLLGYREVFFSSLADNRFDSLNLLDIVRIVEEKVSKLQPQVIYTHYIGDLNIDHQITCKAVLTGTRPMENCSVTDVYCFETLSSTEWNFTGKDVFRPNYFVDVSDTIKAKLDAMSCYHTEIRDFPHPRSLKAIEVNAQKWGSVVGREYVEAFEIIRRLA